MDYDEAEAAYRETAQGLLAQREQHRLASERVPKLEALIWMREAVQHGSNEKARRALFENECADDEEHIEAVEDARQQAHATAMLEIEERIARKRMDYLIATGQPPMDIELAPLNG